MATVDVIKLSYEPTADGFAALFAGTWDKIKGRYLANKSGGTRISSTLNSVSFKAKPGEITAIISSELSERRTLSQLIAQRRGFGNFDGQICISGSPKEGHERISSAFISREAKKLYTPGLSYEDVVYYAAKLRMPFASSAEISKHVDDVLELMDLQKSRKRIIPMVPDVRGTIGGELRCLSIAVEIVAMPEIIVLDDPTRHLDMVVANRIFDRLQVLADNGHTVIAAIPKPTLQMFQHINKVVLMYQGFSIFSGYKKDIIPYFSSIDYSISEETNITEFLIDVSNGTERCIGKRQKDLPDPPLLHASFEKSSYFEKADPTSNFIAILPEKAVRYYGYSTGDGFLAHVYRSRTVFRRAVWTKFRETENIKKGFGANTVVACVIGYFMYGNGEFGNYTKALIMPYNEPQNIVALLFIITAYVIVQQIGNVHTVCQKMRVFRYEQKAGCCPTLAMWLATILSEATFAMFFSTIFSTILFFITKLQGVDEMGFYTSVVAMMAALGCGISTCLAGVFRSEIVVRDVFIFYLFANIMLSGFPFQLPAMTDDARNLSVIDPMRWTFEALMVWKFRGYVDGRSFLTTYDFQNFDKGQIYGILFTFIIFFNAIMLFTLIPPPNTLTRKLRELSGSEMRLKKSRRASVEATDFSDEDLSDEQLNEIQRQKTPQKPLLFSRNTAVAGISSELSSSNSALGLTDRRNNIGPKIEFNGLSYMLKDKDAPLGYRPILSGVTGSFENAKLNAIMGSTQSGKSTLLSVLGGNDPSSDARVMGTVKLNGCPYDTAVKPWRRCAYVDAVDYHYRDITVLEVLTYAALLRCSTTLGLDVAEKNVSMTMALMQLEELANKKTKTLTKGGLRRLSIAEEVVQGLPLLFVDEPVTGVKTAEAAVIMNSLREMVNQERTVVMTAHLPSAEIFGLFDSIVLLSKGCVIFSGPASEALVYFSNLKSLKFDKVLSMYANPADFLTDISSCQLRSENGEPLDTPTLESIFKSSSYCVGEKTYFNERTSFDKGDTVVTNENPLLKGKARGSSVKMERLSIEQRPSSAYNAPKEEPVFRKFSMEQFLFGLFSFCFGTIYEIIWQSPVLFKSRVRIMLVRAIKVLFKREKLIIGAIAVHMLIAFTFSFIGGDLSEETGNVLSMYGLGSMLLILANVQFGFFIFKNNQVFLKEKSRGLYSVFLYWLVGSLPFLVFRFLLGILYGLMNTALGRLNDETAGFYLQITMLMVLSAATIGEALISLSPDKDRTFYAMIPGFGFLLFFFSGLMVKASTLPEWTRAWLPSFSIIRWAMQGMTINRFADSDLFPVIGNYDTYTALLISFGWGGKTKFYCQNIVILNMFIFRVLTYGALYYNSRSQIGRRTLLKEEDDVHQY